VIIVARQLLIFSNRNRNDEKKALRKRLAVTALLLIAVPKGVARGLMKKGALECLETDAFWSWRSKHQIEHIRPFAES